MRQNTAGTTEAKQSIVQTLIDLTEKRKMHWIGSSYAYDPASEHHLICCEMSEYQGKGLLLFLRPSSRDRLRLQAVLRIRTSRREERFPKSFFRALCGKKDTVTRYEDTFIDEEIVDDLWRTIEAGWDVLFRSAMRYADNAYEKKLRDTLKEIQPSP